MGEPTKVDPTDPRALETWVNETEALVDELHALGMDAAAPRGQRTQARRYLRAVMARRFRSLRALIAAIDPTAAVKAGAP